MRSHALALLLLVAAPAAAIAAEPAPPAPSRAEGAATPDEAPPSDEAPPPAEAPPAEASEPAAPALDEALAKRRNHAMGLAVQGREMARAGLVDQAISAYSEALQAWPAYPLVLNELGAIYANKKDLARAEALFRRAVELDPEMTTAWANLAEIQRRMGRFPAAIESYRKVLDATPDDADAFYGLAASYSRAGKRPAARWAMERYLERSGEDAEGPRIAEVKEQLEKLDDDDVDAEAPFELARGTTRPSDPTPPKAEPTPPDEPQITVAPGEPGPLPRHAGDEKFYLRRYVEALALYREALGDGDDVVLLYKIGATYAVMNDYRSALRYWRRALLLEPDRALIVRHLGLATMRLAAQAPPPTAAIPDPVEGARVALIAGDPAQAVARLAGQEGEVAAQLRGEALLLLGDLAGARKNFEAILAAAPEHRDATGGLAEALARQGATAPAEAAMRTWLGDREAAPETFLVLRSNDFLTRLTSEPEE